MVHANNSSADGKCVLVVMGSVRAGRRCPQIAVWVIEQAKKCSSLQYELVDLAEWQLPFDDEAGIPALGVYAQPHTLAWSRKIAEADAIVIVTPQYNWGYPAPLKNAIDHLHDEWAGKPVAIVTYGGHGGGKCAAQLRQVVEGLEMRPTATMPGLKLTREMIGGGPFDPVTDFAEHVEGVQKAIRELVEELEK
jgi:NAD(P)H-dependent FMN reductase